MDPISELDVIFQHSFMTGSRVFGDGTLPNIPTVSDWDIVVPGVCKEVYTSSLMSSLPGASSEASVYFGGVTISAYNDALSINLIPAMINDYRAWYYATLAFRDMWNRTGIIDKEHKIAIFEALRASFRGRLPDLASRMYMNRCRDIAKEARLDTLADATNELFAAVGRLHSVQSKYPKQIPY